MELIIVQALTFTSATQPLEEYFLGLIGETTYTLTIAGYPIVGIVSSQFVSRGSHDLLGRQGSVTL